MEAKSDSTQIVKLTLQNCRVETLTVYIAVYANGKVCLSILGTWTGPA